MRRSEFLQGLHEVLKPRTYFEIGVRRGVSLGLSRSPSVGVDPFYEVTAELRCDVHLVRTTSDEFFARRHPFAHFAEPLVDLAFIDGMHLSEYALRDFMNTERHCHPGSVIVLDDIFPRTQVEAGRARTGTAERGAWTGDVFKVVEVLRRHRPDLTLLEMDTQPTGTLVVLLPAPESEALPTVYDSLVPTLVSPDPQDAPEWAIARRRAMDPVSLLENPVWDQVRTARTLPPGQAREALSGAYARAGLHTASDA